MMNQKNINPSECTALTKADEQYRSDLIAYASKKLSYAHKTEDGRFHYVWRKWFGEEMEHYQNPMHPVVLRASFTNEALENMLVDLKWGCQMRKNRAQLVRSIKNQIKNQ